MNKKRTVFLILSLFFIHSAHGMDNEGTITFITNQKHDYPELVKNIYNDENLNNFGSEQFVCSQEECIKSIKSAQKRGAEVNLTVGAHSQNRQALSEIANIRRDSNVHGKITSGIEYSPSKIVLKGVAPQKGKLLFGSGNTSNFTWKHKPNTSKPVYNFEGGILVENDMPLITQAYTMTKSQLPMLPETEKAIIPITPTKPAIYGSHNTNLSGSLALRLRNFATIEDPNKRVLIRTMTFNDPDIADAIIEFGSGAELIVDNTALTKNGIPLLDAINDAGIPVYVFRAPEGSRAKHHQKSTDLISADKNIHIASTSNLTITEQRNYILFVPNNKNVTNDSAIDFDLIKNKCITYDEAKRLHEEDKIKKSEKRKFTAEDKKPKKASVKKAKK